MFNQIGQNHPCVFLIISKLRTSVWVRKGHYFINPIAHKILTGICYLFGNRYHAAYGRDYPQIISYPDFTVLPFISHEIISKSFCLHVSGFHRIICIIHVLTKRSFYIMDVNMLSFSDCACCYSYRITVFDYATSLSDIFYGNFMAPVRIGKNFYFLSLHLKSFSLL